MVQKAQKVAPVPSLQFGPGPMAGRVMRLDSDDATLGRRDDNHYIVDDPRVSRVHARLSKESGVLIVTDLGSSAGTSVNDEVIAGPHVLHHGDKIAFGPVAAVFQDPSKMNHADDSTQVIEVVKIETGPRLSPRQGQVLELMAEGMTNNEIGQELGVTERTVKAYAQELYDRLGVRNRAGAVAEAARHGLL